MPGCGGGRPQALAPKVLATRSQQLLGPAPKIDAAELGLSSSVFGQSLRMVLTLFSALQHRCAMQPDPVSQTSTSGSVSLCLRDKALM